MSTQSDQVKNASISKNYLLAVWRVPILVLWVMILPLIFLVLRALGLSAYSKVPHLFHRGVCFILGLKVTVSGEMSRARPTLYVSNHISYLDIFALGQIPGFFVAKAEIASWPVLGKLAKFQNTLFIERKSARARDTMLVLQDYLSKAKSLILFPEGTSTAGESVKSFKSSLFASAEVEAEQPPIPIQPVTVAYTHQHGQKMDQAMRDHYAWYDTMPFLGHFLGLLVLKNVDVKVRFHPVCYLVDYQTRKECADDCRAKVAIQLDEFNQTD